jgi:hypothetical protein
VNPQVFYYTNGNSLMTGTISGSSVTSATVRQFNTPPQKYTAINIMDSPDVSIDNTNVVLVGGDNTGLSPEEVFNYNFARDITGPVYTTLTCTGSVNTHNNGCLHKLITTADNNLMIQFASDGSLPEQGERLWAGGTLTVLQDNTSHLDAGYDLNGNAIYVERGNSFSVPTFTNPCPSGWGLDVRNIYNTSSAVCLIDNQPAWDVGYQGNAQQPWVVLSYFDSRTPSPEWFDTDSNYAAPNPSNWYLYEDEIQVVRIDAQNNSSLIYRLARAYSRSNEDFYAQPHAAISRDGRYIAFNSNMAYAHTGCPANFYSSTGCSDVYVIKIK